MMPFMCRCCGESMLSACRGLNPNICRSCEELPEGDSSDGAAATASHLIRLEAVDPGTPTSPQTKAVALANDVPRATATAIDETEARVAS